MSENIQIDYDVNLVNKLQEAGSAVDTFNNNNGEETVYEKLKDIIVKNNAASRIGISLVHKPIASKDNTDSEPTVLADEFRLVRFGNIVFPIEIGKLAPIEGYLLPSKLAFAKDGSINVVELAYTPDIAKYTLTDKDVAAIKEIKAALHGSPLAKVIGVHVVGLYNAGIASAHKNAVSTFPMTEVDSIVEGNASRFESDWEFSSGEAQAVGLLVTAGGEGQNFLCLLLAGRARRWGPAGTNITYGHNANVGDGNNRGNTYNNYYIYGGGYRPY